MLDRRLPDLLLAGGLLGAALLAVAQFLPLFHTYVSTRRAALDTVTAGSEHSWAVLPIALLAAILLLTVRSSGSRAALAGAGVLALAALVITLSVDLPAAHQTGLASVAAGDVPAGNSVAFGLYVEVAGGLILLLDVIAAFVFTSRPPRPSVRSSSDRPPGMSPS